MKRPRPIATWRARRAQAAYERGWRPFMATDPGTDPHGPQTVVWGRARPGLIEITRIEQVPSTHPGGTRDGQ